MRRVYFLGLIFLCTVSAVQAQDLHFSQYYASPLYLNPAFAGTSAGHRFILNHRNQWPSIANGYVSYALSYDANVDDLKSGVGALVTVDRAGSASLRSTTASFVYSYKMNLGNKWIITPGLSFGYGHRNINFNELIFGDQLTFDSDGQVPTVDTQVLNNFESAGYFDFATGILLYNKTFWAGVSVSHLNEPNRSLLNDESIIPMKMSIHAGVKIPLYNGLFKKDRIASLSPSFVYQQQGDFDQLDVGVHFLYQPIVVGVWYRGIPIQQNVKDNISHDALVLILGMQFDAMELGYSYDFTVSELASVSGGAHEFSIRYDLDIVLRSKVKRKDKFIPCPTFTK